MQNDFKIIPIPAFADNYIWLVQYQQHAVVIDPGDASPVLKALQTHHLNLSAICITHHHQDHIGGVHALLQHSPHAHVFAPPCSAFDFAYTPVAEPKVFTAPHSSLHFKVLEVPGHTPEHIAFLLTQQRSHHLFCGDTLFGAGCGRLLGGRAEQLFDSLQKISQLPETTLIYPAHEYTLKNIAFARQIEPENPALITRETETQQRRKQHLPSLPSTLQLELATNPFLRCHLNRASPNALEAFIALRKMRDAF